MSAFTSIPTHAEEGDQFGVSISGIRVIINIGIISGSTCTG